MASLTAQRSRYMQIAQTLLSEIQGGAYPVDTLLPPETELSVQFGVSRFTMREAIGQLVRMGIVSRQAGVGTTVLRTRTAHVFRQVIDRLDDLQHYTAETQLRVLNRSVEEIRDPVIAACLGATPGQLWLQLDCVRRAGDPDLAPICHTRLYLHPAFRSLGGLGGHARRPVFSLIEEQFGERIVEVRQHLSASAMPRRQAGLLGVPAGSAALVVERLYINQRNEAIELAISTHPGSRYQHSQTFRRDY